MKLPKGKLLALTIVAAAIVLVTATGAFTSVSAERTATVNVADDSQALLAMQPCSGPSGAYAEETGDGQLRIILNSSASGVSGVGVNSNAITSADCVFNVTNQGTQEVEVEVIAPSSDGVTFYDSANYGTAGNPGTTVQGTSYDLDGNTVTLDVGDTLSVGVEINTRDYDLSQSDYGFTIQATAT
jgi:hypothetical protein